MVAQAFVRQFAAGQKIDLDVADQEVVLHYALARLNDQVAHREHRVFSQLRELARELAAKRQGRVPDKHRA
jgi:hypothetical protein